MKKGDVSLDRVEDMGDVLSVLNRGIIWRESVLNRVCNFVQAGPLFFTRHNFNARAASYLVKINTLDT